MLFELVDNENNLQNVDDKYILLDIANQPRFRYDF